MKHFHSYFQSSAVLQCSSVDFLRILNSVYNIVLLEDRDLLLLLLLLPTGNIIYRDVINEYGSTSRLVSTVQWIVYVYIVSIYCTSKTKSTEIHPIGTKEN